MDSVWNSADVIHSRRCVAPFRIYRDCEDNILSNRLVLHVPFTTIIMESMTIIQYFICPGIVFNGHFSIRVRVWYYIFYIS